MQDLLMYMVKSLAESPDEIKLTTSEDENAIVLSLQVAESDMGKVIGKQGRIAKALRTIVRAANSRSPKKIVVDINSADDVEDDSE